MRYGVRKKKELVLWGILCVGLILLYLLSSTDWIISRPTPGQANTVSVSTEPPSIWPISRPMTVMVGSMPLRQACRMMMVFRDRPLA